MKKIKLKKSQILIYFCIFILFLILVNAKNYFTSAFAFGALFALMWTGFFVPMIATEYLVANLILMTKLADLYCAIATIFILIITYLIHSKIKKPMNVVLVGVYSVLSQLVTLYYIFNTGNWIDCLIFLVIGLIFLYVCINIFQVFVLRGWYKLTLDELISLLTVVGVMAYGISEIYIFNCALYKYCAVVLILFCLFINKKSLSINIAIAIGLGVAINSGNLTVVGELALLAMIANIYSYPYKYKICVITLIFDLVLQMYFVGIDSEIAYLVAPTLFAITTFVIIPNKIFNKLLDKTAVMDNELSVRNIITSTRKNLKRRMDELSDVFAQMKQINLKLMKQQLECSQVISMLANDLQQSLCKECNNKDYCYRGIGANAQAYILQLLDIALKKGKITLLDLPSQMTQKCGISNLVIGRINQSVIQYRQYESMLNDVNNVKFVLAEQMGAVSQLFVNLSEEMDKNISFEQEIERKILNRLLSNNIVCSEVLIYAEKNQDVSVVAIVKGENAYNPLIEKVISKEMNCCMSVVGVEPTDIKDYYAVSLNRSCKRDIVFGISSRIKSGSVSSGDSHTLIRLGNNKYLLALCDGMGSGENARQMSSLTIGLIENFYKAGFSDEFILNNINKLLNINNQENFSTLDLCVVDLTKEVINFIKIGATYGVIKRDREVEKVENGTLPLGVLKQVKPSISCFGISSKDMIVMVTDGITDAFDNYDEFAEFVNGIASTNPQVVSQTILDEAIRRDNMIVKDDMTVLVARTFLKE